MTGSDMVLRRRARPSETAGVAGFAGFLCIACGPVPVTKASSEDHCDPGDPSCARSIVLELCDEYPEPASIEVADLHVDEDLLTLDYTRRDGCPSPSFRGCWNGAVYDTIPPQLDIMIAMDGAQACEANVAELLDIDLSIIPEVYPDGGAFQVNLLGLDARFTYDY